MLRISATHEFVVAVVDERCDGSATLEYLLDHFVVEDVAVTVGVFVPRPTFINQTVSERVSARRQPPRVLSDLICFMILRPTSGLPGDPNY